MASHQERFAKMTSASVYPLYLTKVEKKGRTKEELEEVIEWLTGFNRKKIQELIKEKVTFEVFFERASLNPNADLITGMICGYRIEEIEIYGNIIYANQIRSTSMRVSITVNQKHIIGFYNHCLIKQNENLLETIRRN